MSRLNAGFTLFGEHMLWTDLVHVSALVYGIFFVMVLAGFWKWLQEARSMTPSADKAAVTI
jgi:hypothetical protein